MVRIIALFSLILGVAGAADVKGKWSVNAKSQSGREYKLELVVREDAGKLQAILSSDEGSVDLGDVRLEGQDFSFKIPLGESPYLVKLTVAADSMKGTFKAPDGSTGPVTCVRPGAGGAAVAGKWKMTAQMPSGGEMKLDIEIKDESGKLSGTISPADGPVLPLQDVKLEGSELSFKVTADPGTYALKLTVSGNSMSGTFQGPDGSGKLSATR